MGGPDQPVSSDQPTLQATEPAVDAGAVEVGLAVVDSIDILIMELMPVQVSVSHSRQLAGWLHNHRPGDN